jgi:hypothetical protein
MAEKDSSLSGDEASEPEIDVQPTRPPGENKIPVAPYLFELVSQRPVGELQAARPCADLHSVNREARVGHVK